MSPVGAGCRGSVLCQESRVTACFAPVGVTPERTPSRRLPVVLQHRVVASPSHATTSAVSSDEVQKQPQHLAKADSVTPLVVAAVVSERVESPETPVDMPSNILHLLKLARCFEERTGPDSTDTMVEIPRTPEISIAGVHGFPGRDVENEACPRPDLQHDLTAAIFQDLELPKAACHVDIPSARLITSPLPEPVPAAATLLSPDLRAASSNVTEDSVLDMGMEDFDRSVELAAEASDRTLLRTLSRIFAGPRRANKLCLAVGGYLSSVKTAHELDVLSRACAAALPTSTWWEGVSLLEDFEAVDLAGGTLRGGLLRRNSPGPSSPAELDTTRETSLPAVLTDDCAAVLGPAEKDLEQVRETSVVEATGEAAISAGTRLEASRTSLSPVPPTVPALDGTPPTTAVGYVTAATPQGEPSAQVVKRLLFPPSPANEQIAPTTSLPWSSDAALLVEGRVDRPRCPRQLKFSGPEETAIKPPAPADEDISPCYVSKGGHQSEAGRVVKLPATSESSELLLDGAESQGTDATAAVEAAATMAQGSVKAGISTGQAASQLFDDHLFWRAPSATVENRQVASAATWSSPASVERNRELEEAIDQDIRRLRCSSAVLGDPDLRSAGAEVTFSFPAASRPAGATETALRDPAREPAGGAPSQRSPSGQAPQARAAMGSGSHKPAGNSPQRASMSPTRSAHSPSVRASGAPDAAAALVQPHAAPSRSPGASGARRPMLAVTGLSVRVTRRTPEPAAAVSPNGTFGGADSRATPTSAEAARRRDGSPGARQPLVARAAAGAAPRDQPVARHRTAAIETGGGCGRGVAANSGMLTNKVDLQSSLRLARRAAPSSTSRPVPAQQLPVVTELEEAAAAAGPASPPAARDARPLRDGGAAPAPASAASASGSLRGGRVSSPVVVCGPAAARATLAALRPPCQPPPPECLRAGSAAPPSGLAQAAVTEI